MSNSCDSTDCSTPGFPVHHQLLELTQTHVHPVGDGIQQSHPLSSPSPPAFNLSQHQHPNPIRLSLFYLATFANADLTMSCFAKEAPDFSTVQLKASFKRGGHCSFPRKLDLDTNSRGPDSIPWATPYNTVIKKPTGQNKVAVQDPGEGRRKKQGARQTNLLRCVNHYS